MLIGTGGQQRPVRHGFEVVIHGIDGSLAVPGPEGVDDLLVLVDGAVRGMGTAVER